MATQITQSQYNTSKQTIRKLYIKVDLLNFNYMMVGSLEGNVISGSININANSENNIGVVKAIKLYHSLYVNINALLIPADGTNTGYFLLTVGTISP